MNYEKRVLELEKEGLTTSDAQAVVDAEEDREQRTKCEGFNCKNCEFDCNN